jgi:hypothetical protein
MKHTHLTLNTVITIISLIVICVLLYTSTIKQEQRYADMMSLLERQQQNLAIQQQNLQDMERKLWNILNVIPEPTPRDLIYKDKQTEVKE